MARRSPTPPATELQVEAAVGRVAIGMDGQTVAADDSLSGRMYATGFADQISTGLALAQARTGYGQPAVLDDPRGYAEDLHTDVVQRHVATGFTSHGVVPSPGHG